MAAPAATASTGAIEGGHEGPAVSSEQRKLAPRQLRRHEEQPHSTRAQPEGSHAIQYVIRGPHTRKHSGLRAGWNANRGKEQSRSDVVKSRQSRQGKGGLVYIYENSWRFTIYLFKSIISSV